MASGGSNGERSFCDLLTAHDPPRREAVDHFETSLELDPADSRAQSGLGYVAETEGRWGEAADLYRRAAAAGADDAWVHYRLGSYLLRQSISLDEAVAEFQQALRASASHLPTHELLGQTFIEMGKPEAAIRSLQRALEMDYEVEDELLAIYYYLGRAHEEVGNNREAMDLYDRVFSLDINFADVTDRLRALR